MSTLMLAAMATLVFCAPGYPGGSGDAQPFLDQFAKAATASAGWKSDSLSAIYDPSEQGGLAKLGDKDSVLAFVPYAFYVQHAAALHLAPLVQADVVGVGTQERWTLVGKAGGAVTGAASMTGYTILSVAGYAPEFVKHSALAAWALPAEVKIEATGQILSALRRVASGEPVVALLDQTQAASLSTLPFAAQIKTLTQSAPLPVAVIAVVDARLSEARAKAFQTALIKMNSENAETLASLRLKGFVLPQLPGDTVKP
ncbi:MAG TPA: PhnD/SsuA/transferrin family substrate-binding protein [Steroidobacteraceae bacterium]|nr:PhnD/SsuA/transferrin family substrate-binding protein [Steroidobacteraceae bacterium]